MTSNQSAGNGQINGRTSNRIKHGIKPAADADE
jgi:hypothetical protein